MIIRRSPLFATLLLAALSPAMQAQSAPARTLTKPDAEFPEPFTQVSGLRELSNGQVVVADARDKTLQLISFDGGTRKIGREGSGPGEYAMPMRLYPGPADTTFLFDPLNSRFLVIDPAGKAVSTFALGGEEGGMRAFMAPTAIDARGRFYFRGAPFTGGGPMGGGGPPQRADSIPIYRYDRATKRTDTLAWVKNDANTNVAGSRGNVRVTVSAQPFAATDQWTVTPDGRLAIVRAGDYHVDWYVNGRRTSGPAIPFERLEVTEADKKAWRDARRSAPMVMMRATTGGRAGGAPQVSREVQTMSAGNMPEPDWPKFKGPFGTVMAAPDGRIWVQRHLRASDPPTYDVIDGSGRVVSKVVLAKGARVVGFGKGTVYVTRSDEDDLQYLERYKL